MIPITQKPLLNKNVDIVMLTSSKRSLDRFTYHVNYGIRGQYDAGEGDSYLPSSPSHGFTYGIAITARLPVSKPARRERFALGWVTPTTGASLHLEYWSTWSTVPRSLYGLLTPRTTPLPSPAPETLRQPISRAPLLYQPGAHERTR